MKGGCEHEQTYAGQFQSGKNVPGFVHIHDTDFSIRVSCPSPPWLLYMGMCQNRGPPKWWVSAWCPLNQPEKAALNQHTHTQTHARMHTRTRDTQRYTERDTDTPTRPHAHAPTRALISRLRTRRSCWNWRRPRRALRWSPRKAAAG